jgi:hypothetical protein
MIKGNRVRDWFIMGSLAVIIGGMGYVYCGDSCVSCQSGEKMRALQRSTYCCKQLKEEAIDTTKENGDSVMGAMLKREGWCEAERLKEAYKVRSDVAALATYLGQIKGNTPEEISDLYLKCMEGRESIEKRRMLRNLLKGEEIVIE